MLKNKSFNIIFVLLLLSTSLTAKFQSEQLTLDNAVTFALQSKTIKNLELRKIMQQDQFSLSFLPYELQSQSSVSIVKDKSEKGQPFAPDVDAKQASITFSKYFPTATSLMLTAKTGQEKLDFLTFADADYYATSLEFTLKQSLVRNKFGSTNIANIKLSNLELESNFYQLALDFETVVYNTVNEYWNLVQAEFLVNTRQQALESSEQLLQANEKRQKQSLVEDRIIYALRANVNMKKGDLEFALLQQQIAKMRFSKVLGIQTLDYSIPISTESIVNLLKKDMIDDPKDYPYETLWEYKLATLGLEQTTMHLDISKDNTKANVDLFATLNTNGIDDSFGTSFTEPLSFGHNLITLGLSMDVKPFSKLNNTQIQLQKNMLMMNENNLELVKDKLDIGLFATKKTFNTLKKQHALSQETVTWLEKKYKEDQHYFELGRLDIDAVIRSKDELTLAKLQANQIYINYAKSIMEWYRARNKVLEVLKIKP